MSKNFFIADSLTSVIPKLRARLIPRPRHKAEMFHFLSAGHIPYLMFKRWEAGTGHIVTVKGCRAGLGAPEKFYSGFVIVQTAECGFEQQIMSICQATSAIKVAVQVAAKLSKKLKLL